jgi:hypothetical protein
MSVMLTSSAAGAVAARAPAASSSRQQRRPLILAQRPRAAVAKAQGVSGNGGVMKSSSPRASSAVGMSTAAGLRNRWCAAPTPSTPRSVVVAADAAAAAAPASEGGETGESAAIVNTIKAIFGAGGFALPWAFAQGGTVLVSLCLAFSCVFALESLKMLVKAQEVLVEGGGRGGGSIILRVSLPFLMHSPPFRVGCKNQPGKAGAPFTGVVLCEYGCCVVAVVC